MPPKRGKARATTAQNSATGSSAQTPQNKRKRGRKSDLQDDELGEEYTPPKTRPNAAKRRITRSARVQSPEPSGSQQEESEVRHDKRHSTPTDPLGPDDVPADPLEPDDVHKVIVYPFNIVRDDNLTSTTIKALYRDSQDARAALHRHIPSLRPGSPFFDVDGAEQDFGALAFMVHAPIGIDVCLGGRADERKKFPDSQCWKYGLGLSFDYLNLSKLPGFVSPAYWARVEEDGAEVARLPPVPVDVDTPDGAMRQQAHQANYIPGLTLAGQINEDTRFNVTVIAEFMDKNSHSWWLDTQGKPSSYPVGHRSRGIAHVATTERMLTLFHRRRPDWSHVDNIDLVGIHPWPPDLHPMGQADETPPSGAVQQDHHGHNELCRCPGHADIGGGEAGRYQQGRPRNTGRICHTVGMDMFNHGIQHPSPCYR